MEGLSINEISTFEDIIVTYNPSLNVTNYSYVVYKDNVVIEKSDLINTKVDIKLTDEGKYKIEIINYDVNGVETKISSGDYIIDRSLPIIKLQNKTYKIKTGESINYLDGVSATDNLDGDITGSITTNIDSIDFNKEGVKKIEYSVTDSSGNIAKETAYVTVKYNNTNLIRMGQFGIIIVLLFIILFLCRYIRSIKLEKRFSKFTINSSKNSSISLFDYLYNKYNILVDKLSKSLSKSNFLINRSKRYEKYNIAFNLNDENNMKFMSRKIFIGFIFILVLLCVNLINSKILSIYGVIFSFVLGFYVLDIIYIIKYSKYRKQIENDMLDAITIMNNGFKAGMSIIQTIDLVTKELSGPISREFEKISLELSYGLDIEVVFKRFSERINSSEAVYLASSLSILNTTGGNIIKVFNSIEKTMYNRRKLQQELKSLTSSSRFIMYVLIFVPPLFVIFLSIMNKGYFDPLFNNPLGITLLVIILIIYITYIFVVKSLMKVRM